MTMFTTFGIIIFWLVTFMLLVVSYFMTYDIVQNITNKVPKIIAGVGSYIVIFAIFSLGHVCVIAISSIIAYDLGGIKTPIQSSHVTHELQSINCGDEFNLFILKNEDGENIMQTIVNNDGKLEIIDLNIKHFNLHFTETENPRIEYYSKIQVKPNIFQCFYKELDTLHVDLNNINSRYKIMNLKGDVYLPLNMNINKNLINVCQTH